MISSLSTRIRDARVQLGVKTQKHIQHQPRLSLACLLLLGPEREQRLSSSPCIHPSMGPPRGRCRSRSLHSLHPNPQPPNPNLLVGLYRLNRHQCSPTLRVWESRSHQRAWHATRPDATAEDIATESPRFWHWHLLECAAGAQR